MGIDYLYCGGCEECYNSQDFTQCHECGDRFEHPREGYYCCECLPIHEYVNYKDHRYCRDCYNNYIIKIKCSICKEKKKKSKFRDCNDCHKKLNYKSTKVYVCNECDDEFLCKNCDDKVYFCDKKCSNKYKIWQRKSRENLKIYEQECKERYDYAKANAIRFDETTWKTYDQLCNKCKIFPCECALIAGTKKMEELKKTAIKFDETKWDIVHSCLCTECNIFPCECLGPDDHWRVYDCIKCHKHLCKCSLEV